ncbi:hypothetical protein ACQP3J_29540, partial [Escherichia coli]
VSGQAGLHSETLSQENNNRKKKEKEKKKILETPTVRAERSLKGTFWKQSVTTPQEGLCIPLSSLDSRVFGAECLSSRPFISP